MAEKYEFRRINREEVPYMFHLILQRMKWMDENGINQWNKTKYDEIYPQSYYERQAEKGSVFVLANKNSKEIVCAAVLKYEDERWKDKENAVYIHNFVSKAGENNIGRMFLRYVEEYAKSKGVEYIRLDSAQDNEKLSHYYETQGFLPVGTCEEGMYKGILRQKTLSR